MTNFNFDAGTIVQVENAINHAHAHGLRCRVWYGDTVTGKAWAEEYDVIGTIGRSTGVVKIPLLIANKRSIGGGAIMTKHIVRIDTTTGCVLYRHPDFKTGMTLDGKTVRQWGEIHSRHDTENQSKRHFDFMTGKRYSK